MATAAMQPFVPGLFATSQGATQTRQYVVAQSSAGELIHRSEWIPGTRPATPGQEIALYGTGFGPTTPRVRSGVIVARPAPLATPFTVTVGGMRATATFGGIIGAGLYQFNIRVPDLPNGDHALVIEIGGQSSPATVVLPVQR
jgi:uncharacterized protein (TIGR03437 family)